MYTGASHLRYMVLCAAGCSPSFEADLGIILVLQGEARCERALLMHRLLW